MSINDTVLGTCSNCGGRVTIPFHWMSVVPPVPTCESCGATALPNGPVIPMGPPVQPAVSRNTKIYDLARRFHGLSLRGWRP
jgi:hypothetical protein